MMIRSFAAGLGVSVLLSMSAGCASSPATAPARTPETSVAAGESAPEIAPPPEQSDFAFDFAPNGEKENTMAKERTVSTALHPKVAAKKNHLHDDDGDTKKVQPVQR